ncbi:MAG: PEP-CTERM/exosortase system-associated acyltransferase [Spongiibacteraceae bacterium]
MSTIALSLAADFSRTFDIKLATDDAARARVFAVRHRVFCQELGYPMENDGKFEADAYDEQSLHCLLHHKPTNTDVGCLRLVLPLADGGGLPFESFGMRFIDRDLLDWKALDSKSCCEISRLAVISQFRRRAGEQNNPEGIGDEEEVDAFMRRRFPFLAVSLYHAVIALILERHFESIFMVIEPRLQRHLQRYGVTVRQISPTFEYYGQRAVHVTTGQQFSKEVASWNTELRELYDEVHRQLLGYLPTIARKHFNA